MNAIVQQFIDSLDRLPVYLSRHVLISVTALAIGIGLSLPLAVLATRRRALSWPMLTVASIFQTIPSIALLVLIYAGVIGLRAVMIERFGVDVPRASFIATIAALTLYSMLPVMRNTVTGIEGVDSSVVEAARGMGMTPRQVLTRVELPLAMPMIIAGVRTATVWVVGIATLSTPVGQSSLGDYIFTGLQLQNWGAVLLGCVSAAALAIVLDMLVAVLQHAARGRSRTLGLLGGAGLAAVIGGGLAAPILVPRAEYVVGAKTFDEQFILASLIRDRLNDAGFHTEKRQGLGSTIAFTQLRYDQIDAYVDYSGTIWTLQMQREQVAEPETVLAEVTHWLQEEHGITCVGPLGFANAYALAMRRDRAEELGIRTMADLAEHAGGLVIGGDYEFFERPEWQSMRDTYGLGFAQVRKYQSTLMYQACRSGEVDVISAFSSDGRIAAYDLVVLEDPLHAIAPYDAILLVAPAASQTPGFIDALRPLIGAIDDDLMREANYMVDRDEDKVSPDETARWLDGRLGGRSQ